MQRQAPSVNMAVYAPHLKEGAGAGHTARKGVALSSAESEARKALNRLRRAAEKAQRELESLTGSLRSAEGSDFPAEVYEQVDAALKHILDFTEEEGTRLQEKVLHAGGLEPGRVRRG